MKSYTGFLRPVLIGFVCVGLVSAANANTSTADNVTIGRYLTVTAKPQRSQQHLLQQQVQIQFPENVLTIKQAMAFLLQFTGFSLANARQMDRASNVMLNEPLSEVDRAIGPMTLEQALLTLAGDTFYLLVDPVHRTIAFQLKPDYSDLYGNLI